MESAWPKPYLHGVSLAGLRRIAAEVLSDVAYSYFETGAGSEVTLQANEAAWSAWFLTPNPLGGGGLLATDSTILGTRVASPVMVAPIASQFLAHPEGEIATVRAAAGKMQISVVSMNANVEIESLCAIPGSNIWFQFYAFEQHAHTLGLLNRVRAAGASAAVLTIDSKIPVPVRRRPHGDTDLPPGLPHPMNDRRPLLQDLDWSLVEWAVRNSGLPLVLKGVMHPDVARRAAEVGCAGIIVSNHGGRQVDGTLPTAEVLPEIVAAVDGAIEVYVDGGIRSGVDVLRALALGARAVLVGRPVLWGLATAGRVGVDKVLALLNDELMAAGRESGVESLAEVPPGLVRRSALVSTRLKGPESIRGR